MFRKAERKQAKLKLALTGPSGSGKTLGALLVARGLVGPEGRIAVIDTENSSSELYAEDHDFDVAPLAPPFSPARYIENIEGAAAAGYDVLIVDSLSHAWTGEGGVLDMHDKAAQASRSGNSYTAWRDVTPQHNRLVDALMQAPLHVIVCMRSKTAHDMVDDGRGKKKPVKIGMAPVQRDGLEYEFTTVLELAVESHVTTTWKDRTRLFENTHEVLTERHGQTLREWLERGVDPAQALLERYLPGIVEAADMDALKRAFAEAYRAAQSLDDQRVIDELLAAKDARKEAFEAELTAALEGESSEVAP